MPKHLPPAPRVWVYVTQEIIDRACEANSGHCMIADAITATVPDAVRSSADLATLRFTDRKKNLRYIYLTPRWVQEALVGFDLGERPHPFRFQLRNGQTVRAGAGSKRDDAGNIVRKPNGRPQHAPRPAPAELIQARDSKIPEVRGGAAPPMGPLAGGSIGSVSKSRRRSFGLRAMDRYVSTEAAKEALNRRAAKDAPGDA